MSFWPSKNPDDYASDPLWEPRERAPKTERQQAKTQLTFASLWLIVGPLNAAGAEGDTMRVLFLLITVLWLGLGIGAVRRLRAP